MTTTNTQNIFLSQVKTVVNQRQTFAQKEYNSQLKEAHLQASAIAESASDYYDQQLDPYQKENNAKKIIDAKKENIQSRDNYRQKIREAQLKAGDDISVAKEKLVKASEDAHGNVAQAQANATDMVKKANDSYSKAKSQASQMKANAQIKANKVASDTKKKTDTMITEANKKAQEEINKAATTTT